MSDAGPYTFAWCDVTDTWDAVKNRYDEFVLNYKLNQTEGNFATFQIEIENPAIATAGLGLLAPGRKIYCMFGKDRGSGPELEFFGRLVAFPQEVSGPTVVLDFIAEPPDYAQRKQDYTRASLKVAPAYDPVLLDVTKRDDPDAIIQYYPEHFSIDRRDWTTSSSDDLVGEDGIEVFGVDEVFWEGMSTNVGEPPVTSVPMDISVTWPNAASGTIDMDESTHVSYTFKSLLSGWPKTGADLGGGWRVKYAAAIDDFNTANGAAISTQYTFKNQASKHEIGDTMNISESRTEAVVGAARVVEFILTQAFAIGIISQNPDEKDHQPSQVNRTGSVFPAGKVTTSLILEYHLGKDQREHLTFRLVADFQALRTSPAGSSGPANPSATIVIDGADVSAPIQQADFITGVALAVEPAPIGDPSKSAYFTTPRGIQTLEAAFTYARAIILRSARAVEVTWPIEEERALDMTIRKNAQLQDPRFCGGVATGKIVSYEARGNGDTREFIGEVTIGCAIGNAGHPTAVAGTGVYANPGYFAGNYQIMDGATVPLGTGDIVYPPPTAPQTAGGLQLPLTKDQVVLEEAWIGSASEQEDAINSSAPTVIQGGATSAQFPTSGNQIEAASNAASVIQEQMAALPVSYRLSLRSVDDETSELVYALGDVVMTVPKLIDLGSSGAP